MLTKYPVKKGECIWLIGASQGIGHSLALTLAKQGVHLIISARDRERLHILQHTLVAQHGISCHIQVLDVVEPESWQEAWEAVPKWLTSCNLTLDRVIYNAGAYQPMSSCSPDVQAVELMWQVNLMGAVRLTSGLIPYWSQSNLSSNPVRHLHLIGSVAGYRGLPNAMGYGLSKAALIHFAQNLCCDLTATNKIRVQIINPGFVKTRLTDQNTFVMPSLMTPDQAAQSIVSAMTSKRFDVRFPWFFANMVYRISRLPYRIYFALMRRVARTNQK
jgi:short-subunit dehydrogenase